MTCGQGQIVRERDGSDLGIFGTDGATGTRALRDDSGVVECRTLIEWQTAPLELLFEHCLCRPCQPRLALPRWHQRQPKRDFGKTDGAGPHLLFFRYTLSAASIAAETRPEAWRKKLPRYPVPVALLGRLAVNQQGQGKGQGKGLGSILLVDACKRVTAASETLAVAAIVVDAKSPNAAAFYLHFGFIELPGQPGRWMLPRSHFAGLA